MEPRSASAGIEVTSVALEGSQENSQSRNGIGNIGGSWTGEKAYTGASYRYDDTKESVHI